MMAAHSIWNSVRMRCTGSSLSNRVEEHGLPDPAPPHRHEQSEELRDRERCEFEREPMRQLRHRDREHEVVEQLEPTGMSLEVMVVA
jgi:hypothetical protein